MKTIIKAIKSGITLNMLIFGCSDFLSSVVAAVAIVVLAAIIVNACVEIGKTMAIVPHNGKG